MPLRSTETLGTVTLVDTNGGAVPGQVDPEGSWTTSELLGPSTAYTLTVAATGPYGTATTSTSTFATLKPKFTATYGLIPTGGVVGVGMPVIVQFASGVVTKAPRADVEKRVKVTTVPTQELMVAAGTISRSFCGDGALQLVFGRRCAVSPLS